jgi:hypothetical protein
MCDSIEIILTSDANDQFNSVAAWDPYNGTCLMQYKGKYLILVIRIEIVK